MKTAIKENSFLLMNQFDDIWFFVYELIQNLQEGAIA